MLNTAKKIRLLYIITILVMILIQLILLQGVCLGTNSWRRVIVKDQTEYEAGTLPGEGMQFPHSMVRSYSNPEYIYWALDCGQGWRSKDGGQTWERFLAKGLGTIFGQSIEVDPANPDTIIIAIDNGWDASAACFQGLYKSTDGGDNWTHVKYISWEKTHRWYRHNIAYALSSISDGEAKIWYAAYSDASGGSTPGGTDGHGIYKSTDGGDNWTKADANVAGHEQIYSLQVHPTDSNTFYLGTDEGLYTSTNGGTSIASLGDLPSGGGNDVVTIQVNLADPNIIYVAVKNKGAYKSTNGGTNFSAFKEANNTVGCHVNLGDPNVIYFLKKSDIEVSQDGGISWESIVSHPREGLGRETGWGSSMIPWDGLGAIIPHPTRTSEAVGYGQAYLFKTTNCTDFYHAISLFSGYVWTVRDGILFDYNNPNRFGFFGADKGIFISENAGRYFEFLETPYSMLLNDWGYTGNSNDLKAGAFQPGTSAFVASGGGIWGWGRMGIAYSPDNDGAWENTTLDGNEWSYNPDDPNSYGAYRNYFYDADDPNILFVADVKSTDGGQSFNHISYLVDNGLQVYGMAPSNSNVIYAMNSTGTHIYRSTDGGVNFSLYVSKTSYGYPSGASTGGAELVFDIDPVDCNVIYSLYWGDLGKYDGSSWGALGLLSYIRSLPDNNDLVTLHGNSAYPGIDAVIVDPNNGSVIYGMVAHAGVSPVYRSTDGGSNWEDISYNLPRHAYGYALSINPHSGEIFVGGSSGTWVFPPPYNQNTPIYSNSVSRSSIANLPPQLSPIGDKSVDEGQELSFTISATDPNGDAITYSAQNLPSGATFSSPFSWTPGYSQAGSYQVTFIASDGSAQDSEMVTITVNNVNRAPVLAAIGNKSVNEGSFLSFSVSATDADSDTITCSAQNLPTGATFSNRTFSWTTGYDQAGSFEVTFIASDGQEQDSETITVTVGNTNRAPVLTAIGNKTVNENATLNFPVSATDADGNPITYSVENLPSGAAFASQSFIWTPGYDQAGSFQVTFNASDGQDQDSETITITVNNVNRAPVLDAIADKSVDDGTLLTFAVNATDPDGDTIEYSATGLPSGAAFAGQTFNWTPAYSQADNSYQVTFIASDGQLQDSQAINIVVSDTSAPAVTNCSPAAGSIQAPLNSLIILHVTDAGEGVDNSSVTITVDDNIVYTGNTDHYASSSGDCRRSGTESDYTFIYQPDEIFDFDQTVSVKVNATDLAGNPMPEHSYSFKTEMRSFGENKKVSSQDIGKGMPGTVCDSSGNIWVAWHAGLTGSRDIYISKLTLGAGNFGAAVQLTGNSVDQCNPAVALDSSDKLYVVWQDNRRGNWDIYVSTSADGVNWSAETRVTDSNDNQINPAVVIDGQSPNRAHIAWQDDRNGNQDIYVATSQNSFLTTTISQITSDSSNQLAPAIAADSSNTIYVVWTDARNASTDIYAAASDSGPWTNVAVVSNAYNQSGPAIAAESAGSVLHLLWVDDISGDLDIYYALSDGLPSSPLSGSSIVDDTSAADQWAPAIVTTGSTGNNLKVFACWQDGRNLSGTNSDTDLYFARLNSGSGTNVLVGDDGTNSSQSEPAMATDEYGNPYLVWTDGRSTNQEIYYAGSTFVAPVVLESKNVTASSGATVGTEPAAINDADDVSVIVSAGACPSDVQITISRIENPRKHTLERFSLPYEFGPSGLEFDQPVTITIPYAVSASTNTASVYWYNTLTGTLSQEGITNVETIVISPTLHALQFKTTHFTEFFIGGGIAAAVGGGGGGGGCSISPAGQGNIAEFLVPYIGLAAAMVIIRLRDMRNRKARNIKKG